MFRFRHYFFAQFFFWIFAKGMKVFQRVFNGFFVVLKFLKCSSEAPKGKTIFVHLSKEVSGDHIINYVK